MFIVACLQDEEPMVLNDEEDLKRQQAAERARDRQDRLRDAYGFHLSNQNYSPLTVHKWDYILWP